MQGIRNSILDELRRLAESYKSDLEIATQREAGVQKQLSLAVTESQATNQAQVSLRDLESSSQTYRALYDNFLQRYMELVQQQSFPITEARVITQASRPLKASAPKLSFVMPIAAFAGLFLGLAIARLRDLSENVFRTTDDVKAVLKTDCIAILPQIEEQKGRPPVAAVLNGPRAIALERQPLLACGQRAIFPLRRIPSARSRSQLTWRYVRGRARSSVSPLRCRTRASRLLRPDLPRSWRRAVPGRFLVDGDLRNPSLTRGLTPDANRGLIEVMAGRDGLSQVVWQEGNTGLHFLPAVVAARTAHTSEILASQAMKALIDDLRKHYDYVVVDLSPLAPVVDVRTTTDIIDSYVFVVEWGRTKIDIVRHALDGARSLRENILGVVLNKADLKLMSRYGHHDYYRNEYYNRYGYSNRSKSTGCCAQRSLAAAACWPVGLPQPCQCFGKPKAPIELLRPS